MIRLVGTNYDTGEEMMLVFDSEKSLSLLLDSGRKIVMNEKLIAISDRDGKSEIAVQL